MNGASLTNAGVVKDARHQIDRLKQQVERLTDWRASVTAVLRRPGGSFYEDVPKHVRELVDAKEQAERTLTALWENVDDLRKLWLGITAIQYEHAAAALKQVLTDPAPTKEQR